MLHVLLLGPSIFLPWYVQNVRDWELINVELEAEPRSPPVIAMPEDSGFLLKQQQQQQQQHWGSLSKVIVTLFSVLVVHNVDAAAAAAAAVNSRVVVSDREASNAFSRRVLEALDLLEQGRQLQAQGNYAGAVQSFSQVIDKAGDLALAEYARVGHALSLYEVGDHGDAIIEMEDMSISLKGYPEIHAALAAALYADKHSPILAEKQFTIATLLDPRYANVSFVKETKHWPPSLAAALEKFINLE